MSINIELDTIDTKLSIGMEKTIKAIVSPADASEKVVWSVNNENVLLTVNDKVPENTLLLYGNELHPTLENCEVIQTENSFSLTSYNASNAVVKYELFGLDPNETYTLTMNYTTNIAVEIYHGDTCTSGNTAKIYNLTGHSSYTIVFYNDLGTSENWSITNITFKDSKGGENRPVYDGRTATIKALSEGNAVLTCSNQNKDIITTCNIEVLSYIEDKDLGYRRGLFSWIYDDLLECNAIARAANVLNLTELYQLIENITTFTQTEFDELSDAIYNLKCATKHNVDLVYLDGAAEWYVDPAPAKARIDKIVEFNTSNKNNIAINKIMFDIEPWSAGITGWYPDYQVTMLEIYNYCKSKNLELLLCVPFWLDNGIDPTIVTDFHKIVIDLCDAYVCMNYNKNAYLTAMDIEMEYIKEKNKYVYSAAECQPVNDQWGVTENLTYYNDGLDVLYSHWRNLYDKYAYDKLGFAIHDFNNAIKQWTNEVDITEAAIQSVSFDKESDHIVSNDSVPVVYKLNYDWAPINANKDFNISISDPTIATYDAISDSIIFNKNGTVDVIITSNENQSITDNIQLTLTGQTEEPEKQLVAEYKFNNTLYDLIPEFNAEFTDYTHEDIVDGEVTTRTIYSSSLPTMIRFGSGDSNSTNRESSLLEITELKTDNLTTMSYMFANCENLTYINSSNWNTSNVTEMIWLFVRCNSLRTVEGINNWDTKKVTNMDSVFSGCRSLTSLDLSNWNTSQVADIGWMFDNCNSLISLDLSNWNTANVEYIEGMFTNCSSLTSLDLSNWNTSQVTNMNNMFEGCSSLTSLDISNFDLNNVNTYYSGLFLNCNKLLTVNMNNSDYNSVNKIIEQLPTRTSNAMGALSIAGVDDISQVNINDAKTKFWIIENSREIKSIKINNKDISKVYKGSLRIKKMYIG